MRCAINPHLVDHVIAHHPKTLPMYVTHGTTWVRCFCGAETPRRSKFWSDIYLHMEAEGGLVAHLMYCLMNGEQP